MQACIQIQDILKRLPCPHPAARNSIIWYLSRKSVEGAYLAGKAAKFATSLPQVTRKCHSFPSSHQAINDEPTTASITEPFCTKPAYLLGKFKALRSLSQPDNLFFAHIFSGCFPLKQYLRRFQLEIIME